MNRSSKVTQEEKRKIVERAVAIKERTLTPPTRTWRQVSSTSASSGRWRAIPPRENHCSNARWPFEKPRSVAITSWSPPR